MQISVARRGTIIGEYSLEKLNGALADGTVNSETDWAWHRGLTKWVALAEVQGVILPKELEKPPMRIFIARGGTTIGEFSLEKLNGALTDGTVNAETDCAWHRGLAVWVAVTEIDGVVVPKNVGKYRELAVRMGGLVAAAAIAVGVAAAGQLIRREAADAEREANGAGKRRRSERLPKEEPEARRPAPKSEIKGGCPVCGARVNYRSGKCSSCATFLAICGKCGELRKRTDIVDAGDLYYIPGRNPVSAPVCRVPCYGEAAREAAESRRQGEIATAQAEAARRDPRYG